MYNIKFLWFAIQIRKIEEEKRLEQEKKERKKQKEKERKERLKAEGKLLTPKQKQDLRRAQGLLEHLKVRHLAGYFILISHGDIALHRPGYNQHGY